MGAHRIVKSEEQGEMKQAGDADSTSDKSSLFQCISCKNFRYFINRKGHNSLQALGECRSNSWDGNKGQWPLLNHPCNSFVEREINPGSGKA